LLPQSAKITNTTNIINVINITACRTGGVIGHACFARRQMDV